VDVRTVAGKSGNRTRHLAVAITPPADLPGQHRRHPPPRQHAVRPRHLGRRESAMDAGKLTRRREIARVAAGFVDNLCCGLLTHVPSREARKGGHASSR
jgi:hypothetical protein